MFTAEEVIEEARDQHAAFNHRDHPPLALLTRLNASASALRNRIMQLDETAVATEQVQAMPLASFDAGITLTVGTVNIIAVAAKATGTPAKVLPVALLPHAHRFDLTQPTFACWEVNGVLYLRAPDTIWANIAEIGILSVPPWTRLTTLKTQVPLPDDTRPALAADLALFMARRRPVEGLDLRGFREQADLLAAQYLATVANRVAGRQFRVRNVWN